jgi:hypothetical protein
MIDKDVFIKTVLEKAQKLSVGHYLDIRSYKRNRSILLIREAEDRYRIIENGFFQYEFQVAFAEIRQLFKKILKREFPRSHKIRLYAMGPYDKENVQKIQRKKL